MNRREISATDPLGPAWRRMKGMLFPFVAEKWFVLGFTAWLATLGEGGGYSGGFDPEAFKALSGGEPQVEMPDLGGAEIGMILLIAIPILLIVVAITLALLWVKCRGRFMFLDNVAWNRAQVKAPWRAYAAEGRSLFLWDVVAGGVFVLPLLLGLAVAVAVMLPSLRGGSPHWAALLLPALLFLLPAMLWCLTYGVAQRLATDCVAPLMYARRLRVLDAWRAFFALAKGNAGALALYLILRWALFSACMFAVVLAGCLTCCCGLLLVSIPYLGTVILLPLWVFFQSYSLEFMRQFAPDLETALGGAGAPPPTPAS